MDLTDQDLHQAEVLTHIVHLVILLQVGVRVHIGHQVALLLVEAQVGHIDLEVLLQAAALALPLAVVLVREDQVHLEVEVNNKK